MADRTLIYSHRAGAGYLPENSLPAVKHSLTLDIDFIDIDVVLSSDKKLISYHDPILNPDFTRDKEGFYISNDIAVKNLKAKELKSFDIGKIKPGTERAYLFPNQESIDGTSVSSLDEIIEQILAAPKEINIQIEVKINPFEPENTFPVHDFVEALKHTLLKHSIVSLVEIQSFNWAFLIALQKELPQVKTAYLVDVIENSNNEIQPDLDSMWTAGHLIEDLEYSLVSTVKKLGGSIIGPDYRLVTPSLVENAQKLGLKVVPWTVDDPDHMSKLIDMNVDGIITNIPKTLTQVLNAKQRKSNLES